MRQTDESTVRGGRCVYLFISGRRSALVVGGPEG